MAMLQPAKWALGLCTLWPLGRLLHSGYEMLVSGPDPANPFREFRPTTTLDFVSLALYVGLLAFFLIYVFRSKRVLPDKRKAWTLFLLCAGFVAMPLFWFTYFWQPTPAIEPADP